MMRTLYQFPMSHYCEKARWLLDHKELPYVAQNLPPVLHYRKVRKHTQRHSLPVLQEGRTWVDDSTKIALYLDMKYPEHNLLRKTPYYCEQILRIDRLSQRLGRHVRRWLYYYLLQQPYSYVLPMMLGEKGWLKDWQQYSLPALKLLLKVSLKINTETMQYSKHCLQQMIQQLEKTLQENDGDYLVADSLTLADISVCSMLAPLLMIPTTPWEQHHAEPYATEVLDFKQQLTDTALGQYVIKMYHHERNARVDWRGVD